MFSSAGSVSVMTTAQSKLYRQHEALHRQRLLGGSFRRTESTFFSLLKLPVVSVLVPFCLVALSSRKLLTQGAGLLRCSKRGRVVRRRRTVVQVSWTFNCRTGFSFFFWNCVLLRGSSALPSFSACCRWFISTRLSALLCLRCSLLTSRRGGGVGSQMYLY